MFIWCKVIENGKRCLRQCWATPTPFSEVYLCPVHGLVDADGNLVEFSTKEQFDDYWDSTFKMTKETKTGKYNKRIDKCKEIVCMLDIVLKRELIKHPEWNLKYQEVN